MKLFPFIKIPLLGENFFVTIFIGNLCLPNDLSVTKSSLRESSSSLLEKELPGFLLPSRVNFRNFNDDTISLSLVELSEQLSFLFDFFLRLVEEVVLISSVIK